MFFAVFYSFIFDFLEFPSVKSFKIFTAHHTQRDTNFNHEKSRVCKAVSIFWNLCLLPLPKNWSYSFPWNTSSGYSEIFIKSLPNFKEFHRRKREKIHFQFCFWCSCWRNNTSKTTDVSLQARADYLNFRPQRACDRKTIESHLKTMQLALYYNEQPWIGMYCRVCYEYPCIAMYNHEQPSLILNFFRLYFSQLRT